MIEDEILMILINDPHKLRNGFLYIITAHDPCNKTCAYGTMIKHFLQVVFFYSAYCHKRDICVLYNMVKI